MFFVKNILFALFLLLLRTNFKRLLFPNLDSFNKKKTKCERKNYSSHCEFDNFGSQLLSNKAQACISANFTRLYLPFWVSSGFVFYDSNLNGRNKIFYEIQFSIKCYFVVVNSIKNESLLTGHRIKTDMKLTKFIFVISI